MQCRQQRSGFGVILFAASLLVAESSGGDDGASRVEVPTPPENTEKAAKLDLILKRWERRDAGIQTLDVAFTRVDESKVWHEKVTYEGRYRDKGRNLVRYDFMPQVDGEASRGEKNVVLTSEGVWQFLPSRRQVFVFPVLSREERALAEQEAPRVTKFFDRIALAALIHRAVAYRQAPFFFMINAEEFKRAYQVELVDENDRHCLLSLVPRRAIEKEMWSLAYVWLEKESSCLLRVQMHDPSNGKDTRTYTFRRIAKDVTIEDAVFDAEEITRRKVAEGWTLVEMPREKSK